MNSDLRNERIRRILAGEELTLPANSSMALKRHAEAEGHRIFRRCTDKRTAVLRLRRESDPPERERNTVLDQCNAVKAGETVVVPKCTAYRVRHRLIGDGLRTVITAAALSGFRRVRLWQASDGEQRRGYTDLHAERRGDILAGKAITVPQNTALRLVRELAAEGHKVGHRTVRENGKRAALVGIGVGPAEMGRPKKAKARKSRLPRPRTNRETMEALAAFWACSECVETGDLDPGPQDLEHEGRWVCNSCAALMA